MKVTLGDGREVECANGKTIIEPGSFEPDSIMRWDVKKSKPGGACSREDYVPGKELGVPEVAKRLGVSENTARTQLLSFRQRYGEEIVKKTGRRLFITEGALERITKPEPKPELLDLVNDHADRLDVIEKRLDNALERLEKMTIQVDYLNDAD